MKIALAVDGSSYTKRMLSHLAAHDELTGKGNEFVALHVTAELPAYAAAYVPRDTLQQYYDDKREKVLKPVREFARMQGWPWRERHAVGHPGDALARLVNDEAPDLLVMGSHGHSALASALLGSVSTRVLASTQVPTLLIR